MDKVRMVAGKTPKQERLNSYFEIALENTPLNVRYVVIWDKPQNGRRGKSYAKEGYICAPRLTSIAKLWTFLHECAHMLLHNDEVLGDCHPVCREELEADDHVRAIFKKNGLRPPKNAGFGRYQILVTYLYNDIETGLKVDLWTAKRLKYTASGLRDIGAKDWQIPNGL
jgi:hypothetical protein